MVDRRQDFVVLKEEKGNYIYFKGSLALDDRAEVNVDPNIAAGKGPRDESVKYTVTSSGKSFGDFFLQNWYDETPEKLYLVKLRNPRLTYEIDFWSCMRVQEVPSEPDAVAAVLELRDSSGPAVAPSERMQRMHDVFTKEISEIMLSNLSSGQLPAAKRSRVDADGAAGYLRVDSMPKKEPLVRNPNSPYAVEVARVRQSIYNAGMDSIQEFDEKARHWEIDSAAGDLASWHHLVKAMVTGVTAAIISTKSDERKTSRMTVAEMVEARLLQRISIITATMSLYASRRWRRSGTVAFPKLM